MKTEVLRIKTGSDHRDAVDQAAGVLRSGGVVVFPTETVYGIGANAYSDDAVEKIFRAKGRPQDNPLIVHVDSLNSIGMAALTGGISIEPLKTLWPGPLSVLMKKNPLVSSLCTAGLDTVVVRCPDNAFARDMITAAGFPVAAPSANVAGRPSGSDAHDILAELDGRVDLIIDAGRSKFGIESTIVDPLHRPPRILRPGAFAVEDLEKFFPGIVQEKFKIGSDEKPLTPGMKYRHYSPEKPLYFATPAQIIDLNRSDRGREFAYICSRELSGEIDGLRIELGSRENLYEIASSLYSSLRKLDQVPRKMGVIEVFPERGIGVAIMNRIEKAALPLGRAPKS